MIKTIGLFLLMLLKLLGGLLLVLLLVLAAALLLISFVPVRYDVLVQNEKIADPDIHNPVKNIRVQIKISWLLHLIYVTVSYGPEGLANKIKAAGIDVQKALAWFSGRKEARRIRREARKQKKGKNAGQTVQEQDSGVNELQENTEGSEIIADPKETDAEDIKTDRHTEKPVLNDTGQEQVLADQDSEKIRTDHPGTEQNPDASAYRKKTGKDTRKQKRTRKRKKPEKRAQKKAFRKKMPHKNTGTEKKGSHSGKMSSIRDKFRQLYKEYRDETNRRAVSHLWKEICRLLRNYKPRKFKADLTFSLSDPALTGGVLGMISLMPAVYRYPCSIIPDFESDRLYMEGSLMAQGKVTVYVFLASLLRLARDKEFRKALKRLMKRG